METIGAIVLAAGGSTRLGKPKQLLPFRGQSLLRRVVEAAKEAACEPIIVVTGSDTKTIAQALEGMEVAIAFNAGWRDGIGSSISAGVRFLLETNAKASSVVLLACDQPFVTASVIEALKTQRAESHRSVVASRYAGTLGIPALFDRSLFETLLALRGDSGAKPLLLLEPNEVASIEFPRGAIDIDTVQDYEKLRQDSFA